MSKRFFTKETDQINGLLDKGCSFEGKLTFDGIVQINGDFRGDILSDGTLVIGQDAHVHAKILVDTLIVNGRIEGIVEAKNKIEIRSSAQILGDVITKGLVIEDGGILQGHCQMQSSEQSLPVMRQPTHEEEFFVQSTDDPMVM
jgi:cytoskeletal protein CcmA (bactofilin family)